MVMIATTVAVFAHIADLFLHALRDIAINTGRIADQMEIYNMGYDPEDPGDGEPLYQILTNNAEDKPPVIPDTKVVGIGNARHYGGQR